MNDNKLIAEFMSVEYTGTRVKDYDTSWDWLMPVVNKIEMECEGVPLQLLDCSLYSEIDEVYQAVVEFIKTYNSERSKWNEQTRIEEGLDHKG